MGVIKITEFIDCRFELGFNFVIPLGNGYAAIYVGHERAMWLINRHGYTTRQPVCPKRHWAGQAINQDPFVETDFDARHCSSPSFRWFLCILKPGNCTQSKTFVIAASKLASPTQTEKPVVLAHNIKHENQNEGRRLFLFNPETIRRKPSSIGFGQRLFDATTATRRKLAVVRAGFKTRFRLEIGLEN
jgi:hypothetical protein